MTPSESDLDKNKRSDCCNAPVYIGGKGTTHYYVCKKCDKTCDAITMEMKSKRIKKRLEERKCVACGEPMEMAYDNILKRKSKYLWKCTCGCMPDNMRLAIL